MVRSLSTDSLTGKEPILGISKDPEGDINEAVEEIRAEVEARQKKLRADFEAHQPKVNGMNGMNGTNGTKAHTE